MAAIKPHLAQDDEASYAEKAYWRCSSAGSAGLGDADAVCPTPQEIAGQAHAELMGTAWVRAALIERMQGRKIWIDYDSDGEPSIAIDKPVQGPAWNPTGGSRRTTILGWTTKMGAPSFSLPAGAPTMGGACPGATAGQTIASPEARQAQARLLMPVLNKYNQHGNRTLPVVRSVNAAKAVCEFCYAEGGQYATSGVQNAQLMRFAWAQRAVGRPGHVPGVSEFYIVMLDAIDAADFKENKEPKHFGNHRFFRIHDSGDFYSPAYLAEWKKITLHYHPRYGGEGLRFASTKTSTQYAGTPREQQIQGDVGASEVVIAQVGKGHPNPIFFWAPTRVWAKGEHEVQQVSRINGIRVGGDSTWDNFAIRPSGYHIDQHGPFIPLDGWAAPSTVYAHDSKDQAEGVAYDWDCLAYAVEKGPSCRGAENPEGQVGCRACWKHTDLAVNYTLHL